MKFVTAFLLAIVGLSSANVAPLGPQACPAGTQLYSFNGCGYVTREATCYESRPRPDKQQTCGYSACHCIHPTVRNEATGQCVHLDKCPNAKIIHGHGGGGRLKIERRQLQKGAQIPVPPRQKLPVPVPYVPAPVAPVPYVRAPIVPTPVAPVSYVPAPLVPTPVVPTPVVPASVVPVPYVPAPVVPTPVVPKPVYNAGYTNYNSGFNTENTGYTNSNTGYTNNNNGNSGYRNYDTAFRNRVWQ